jgi:hypothetical protein
VCITRVFIICTLHQIFYDDQIKEDGMCVICTNNREMGIAYGILVAILKGRGGSGNREAEHITMGRLLTGFGDGPSEHEN